jgi:hypothetical protein
MASSRIPAWPWLLVVLSTTCASPQVEPGHATSLRLSAVRAVAGARRYQRVEDLPVAPVRRPEDLPVAPTRVRALRPDEVTPALIRVADKLLWDDDPPLGTQVDFVVEGREYMARLELHFHDVGGPLRPWGYHKGVTLYATQ